MKYSDENFKEFIRGYHMALLLIKIYFVSPFWVWQGCKQRWTNYFVNVTVLPTNYNLYFLFQSAKLKHSKKHSEIKKIKIKNRDIHNNGKSLEAAFGKNPKLLF